VIWMILNGRRDGTLKKPYHFTDMSDVVCRHPGCEKRLKKNVVERKSMYATHCFKHEPKHRISGHSKRSR
jgi:hypothetical protein